MAESPANLDDLVRGIASEIGATEAAAFSVKPDFFDGHQLDPLLHIRRDNPDAATRAAAVAAFKEILTPCVQQAKDGAVEIGSWDGQRRQYCLVTLARRGETVAGAVAFIVRCRDEQDADILLRRVQRAASGF